VTLTGCIKDIPNEATNPYFFEKPVGFPEPTYTFYNNELTEDGFKLGKKLFFDPMLSIDGTVSCGSCHIQSTAFADQQLHHISVGVQNRVGIRNALPLFNLAFYKEFFWDGGVTHLDFVPINAIESPFEMDETLLGVLEKLRLSKEYPALYEKAFGTTTINTGLTMDALAQFMNRMISANSKYDQSLKGEVELTEKEQRGLQLFNEHCENCHSGILFTNQEYHNNGISTVFPDSGRALISANNMDIGKFRVPSLRNIDRTSPYMHNAKFQTLEEVLEHYANGVQQSATVDSRLILPNGTLGIPLNPQQQADIIAFLKTLTDFDFINDPLFFKD
jgi:cytochrome c peroxidase